MDDQSDERTKVLSQDQATLQQELAKAKEQEACLIIIRGSPQGHRFILSEAASNLGRDANCEIAIMDQSISRKHAKLIKRDDQIWIEDLGSANGTVVNGNKLAPGESRPLAKEDMIKIGNSILKFLPAGEIEILFYGNLNSALHIDPLTKVYNRRYLLEALEAEFKRAKALHTDFSLLFLDIDHFKKVNDTYGHDAGDYVLREFANVIKSQFVRPKDVFARYGGEEFVILLSQMDAKASVAVAEKMRRAVESHPFILDQNRIPITSSFGVAELSSEIESFQTLLKKADQALYKAKHGGRNRVEVG